MWVSPMWLCLWFLCFLSCTLFVFFFFFLLRLSQSLYVALLFAMESLNNIFLLSLDFLKLCIYSFNNKTLWIRWIIKFSFCFFVEQTIGNLTHDNYTIGWTYLEIQGLLVCIHRNPIYKNSCHKWIKMKNWRSKVNIQNWVSNNIPLQWKVSQEKMGKSISNYRFSDLNPMKVKISSHWYLISFTHHLISFILHLFNNFSVELIWP